MNRLYEFGLNVWGMFYSSKLPVELQLPPVEMEGFVRGAMSRWAGLSDGMNMEFGIFQLLGGEFVNRAAHVWWPPEVLLMEDLSLAFYVVEEQRQLGMPNDPIDIRRLEWLITQYFKRIRVKRSSDDVARLVHEYLVAHSLPDTNVPRFQRGITPIDHPLLHQQRLLDRQISERLRYREHPASLGDLGLYVSSDSDADRYEWCTPLNCMTFASTRGDGDHYSLLLHNDAITSESPVVLTRPSEGESLIVGESLLDFLCFGVHVGYFDVLANLPFCTSDSNVADAVDRWHAETFGDNRHIQELLGLVADQLTLKPWTDRSRFDELQSRFRSKLVLPPDARP